MLSERAPRPPRFIGHSTWMSPDRVEAEARRDALADDLQDLGDAVLGIGAFDEMEVAGRILHPLRHQSLVDAVRVDDDPARGRLAEDLRQPHDRHRVRADDVGEHLPGPTDGS